MLTRFKGLGLFMMFMALVSSCRKDEVGGPSSDAASLTLTVGLPSITLDTRAREMYTDDDDSKFGKIVSDPFATDLTGWTDFEKLIDAREIYRLTLFLVDKVDGVLVGYRDLYKGSPDMTSSDSAEGANGWLEGADVKTDAVYGTSVKVTFNYDHPLHKLSDGSSLESLERGLYRMIVVANWSEHTLEVKDKDGNDLGERTYPGLKDNAHRDDNGDDIPFETYVSGVIKQYEGQTASSPLKFSGSGSQYEHYHRLLDFAMHSSDTDFLCNLAPQPLTLIQDFELLPGMNSISGQLKRSWARLRVTVENSSHEVLTVHNISFGDNTTRNYSFLFVNPYDEEGSFIHPNDSTEHGAPNIFKGSDEESGQYTNPYNALVSTKEKTKIDGLKNGNIKIIFDGYILDSDSHDKLFSYNLDIEYEGKSVKKLRRAKDGTSWAVNESSPKDVTDKGLYVIQNQTSQKRILYAGTDCLETVQLSNDGHGNFLDKDYYFEPVQVFRFIRARDEHDNPLSETIKKTHVNEGEEDEYPVFNIQTYDGLYWLGTPQDDSGKNLALLPSSADPTSYVIRDDGIRDGDKYKDFRYLCFYSQKKDDKGVRLFINVNGNSAKQDNVNGWWDNDAGSEFYLHKVEEFEEKARYNGAVTLSTIDPETSVSTPVKTIHRNDFINIYITASYNEKSGEIDFKVSNWNEKGGDIEFN